MSMQTDLLVIGGGINGAGIARDAAGRGLRVMLVEKDDLAEHTSSASTKLIHGGLRYLEHKDFALVRHSLMEREVLLRAAPHIIWPLRFVLPHHKALRPRWMIRLGLFLYDNLGGRKLLPPSKGIDMRRHPAGEPVKHAFTAAFEYSDCWVQDARLVVLNARDAKARGADVRTRTECLTLRRGDEAWTATLRDNRTGKTSEVTARAVVNATGPWVERTLNLSKDEPSEHGVRLVRGSHVVVPKLYDHPFAYIFQNADGRILFSVPFENDFTLLGTTDVEQKSDPGEVSIADDEVDYICKAVSEYFATPVRREQVVWTYSGVRPLYDDASANASKVTRDYVLHLDDDGPAILSVFGGKITTFRKLSEQVVDMLAGPMQIPKGAWTSGASLPGGDIPDANYDGFVRDLRKRYDWLPEALLQDYARNYGTEVHTILDGATSVSELGEHFGGPLYEAEVRFLVEHEWAIDADDILWRRSKKGLKVPAGTAEKLDDWLSKQPALAAA